MSNRPKIGNYSFVPEFKNVLSARNFTDATKKTYVSLLNKFILEFKHNIKDATSAQLTEYIITVGSRSTVAQMHGVLNNFYKYVLKQPNKIKYVPYPKNEHKLPHIPTKQQILTMIDKTSNIKHKLIISILFATGIRLQELLNLRWCDIKREAGINPLSLHIRGKGNKDRILPLSETMNSQLMDYCKIYELGCTTNKNHFIFGNEKPYSAKSVSLVINKAAKEAGLANVTPHKIRHAAFTHLRDNNYDIETIRELAGHASAATTLIYARLNPQKIVMPL